VQKELCAFFVPVPVDRIDSFGIEAGGAANNAMNLVPFEQKKFSQIGTVLAGDSGNQSALIGH
jgi:bifunctional ADP-heptose synthase (sugar kinase/adenylyltransferase)